VSDGRRSANRELAALVASRAGATAGDDGHAEAAAPGTGSTLPFLLLRLGSRWFGLRAESVREVVGHEVVNRVPGQPAHVRGVSMIHGRMVPVVALDVLLRAHVAAFSDTSAAEAGGDGGGGGDMPRFRLDVLLRAHVAAFSDAGEAETGRDGGDMPRSRLVVLAGDQLEIAILADDARGVMHLPAPLEAPADGGRLRFVLGEIPWNEHLVCVLDGAALLTAALAPGTA
jgi:chemotaxis signal transduction protein